MLDKLKEEFRIRPRAGVDSFKSHLLVYFLFGFCVFVWGFLFVSLFATKKVKLTNEALTPSALSMDMFLEGTCSSNTNYTLGQTPVTWFSSVISIQCLLRWWTSRTVTFCWLLQTTFVLPSSPFPSVTTLVQS